MKKLALILILSFTLPLISLSEVGPASNNKKKEKLTGAYSTTCHSKTKDFNKKKFRIAEVFKSNNKSTSTSNTKKRKLSN